MAIRIKSRWHQSERNTSRNKTYADHASALTFIVWRLSLEGARSLHGEGFDYLSDRERIAVITEFLGFLVQCVDRLAHQRLPDQDREVLVNALGYGLGVQMQDNLTDIAGPGHYYDAFVDALNTRLDEYSRTSFEASGPGFDALRVFGAGVLAIMGETQTNRWVIDQIMHIAGPEVYEKTRDALANLLDS
jgi:hypothetical protein